LVDRLDFGGEKKTLSGAKGVIAGVRDFPSQQNGQKQRLGEKHILPNSGIQRGYPVRVKCGGRREKTTYWEEMKEKNRKNPEGGIGALKVPRTRTVLLRGAKVGTGGRVKKGNKKAGKLKRG